MMDNREKGTVKLTYNQKYEKILGTILAKGTHESWEGEVGSVEVETAWRGWMVAQSLGDGSRS